MTTKNLTPKGNKMVARHSMEDQMNRLSRDMDRIFGDFFGSTGLPRLFRFPEQWEAVAQGPRCDVEDRGNEYVLTAEVPGYTREQLHIDVTEDSVTLKGERAEQSDGGDTRYVCRESFAGSFERTLRLPNQLNVDGVEAKLKDGMLTLVLPKMHEEHHRRIEVSEE